MAEAKRKARQHKTVRRTYMVYLLGIDIAFPLSGITAKCDYGELAAATEMSRKQNPQIEMLRAPKNIMMMKD